MLCMETYNYFFNPGFPEHETLFFWLFSTTRNPDFFNYQTRVFEKSWNCCCIPLLAILITLKFKIGACDGQISTFELSAIIMRYEVRVCLVTIVRSLLVRLYFRLIDLFRRILASYCT